MIPTIYMYYSYLKLTWGYGSDSQVILVLENYVSNVRINTL